MTYEKLTRRQRIAAELYAYSYANYSDHLGNERFTRYMPENVDLLERAVKEGWDHERIARELEMKAEDVPKLLHRLADALKIVDAPNASESFRESDRQQLDEFLCGKVTDPAELEQIVVQMGYCAADMGNLLEWEGKRLIDYSEWLRRTPECDYSGIGLPNLPGFKDDPE